MKDTVYLSSLAGRPLTEYLRQQGFRLHLLDGSSSPVYKEVSTHADIHMCQLGVWDSPVLFMGNTEKLGNVYPGNIIYNAVCTGKYYIHNLKYSDSALTAAAEKRQHDICPEQTPEKIHVSQGYTRCCCLPVDDTSFITSDRGIAASLEQAHAEVLLISAGHISLPGFDYGFIGGCAGHLMINGRRTIVFNGDLESHPDCKEITSFIKDRDIDIVSFADYPLTDIGSILYGRPYLC